jgi:DNA (cytosine-5)-methyltransferase 1
MAGGFETVAMCELPDNQAVLRKHWPDVQYYGDIKELTYERLQADGIVSASKGECSNGGSDNAREACKPSGQEQIGDGSGKEHQAGAKRIDIITGGFPCQPFSHAGQRRGTEDDRHLWPEMLRVISEVRPTWVIGENVAGIVSMELSTLSSQVESKTLDRHPESDHFNNVLSREANMLLNGICEDLEQIGYEVQPLVIPACGIDARHRRDRVWIIAHSEVKQCDGSNHNSGVITRPKKVSKPGDSCGQTDVPNTGHTEPQGRQTTTGHSGQGSASPGRTWAVEPDVGRVADGIPGRVDRLRGLGNAVVPQVVAELGRAIMEQHK